jgi:aspartyl-tRNA(Asn)/glutamyl-tRNA(Gln) amidotransferase subunit B
LLQNAAKLANERCVPVDALGVAAADMAALAALRERGEIGANALDPVLLALIGSGRPVPGEGVRGIAERLGLIQVRDEGQLVAWCAQVLEDPANAAAVADVRAGKDAAVGRLVGDAMKRSAGRADAKAVRAMLIAMIRGAG